MPIFSRRSAPTPSSVEPAAAVTATAPAEPVVAISLDAVIAMSGRSRRTWWRRMEDGRVTKLPADARGRTLLAFEDVRGAIGLDFTEDDVATLARADGGDAQAQAEVGALFAVAAVQALVPASPAQSAAAAAKKTACAEAALYWLVQAAEQNQADAMQWLAVLYAAGYGEESAQNAQHLAVMWLAKAAAHGHAIATQQMQALIPFNSST